MQTYINSTFLVFCLFCFANADEQRNVSTNPAKPMVESLMLPNYDPSPAMDFPIVFVSGNNS